ncbi:redoxin family protein [Sphingomonas sp. DG1-23]|uniref:redoxin family protein n=1 Tax=Sphingomonas sp. DG1-23 TaxID=3068316 RepID=UPI00273DEA61|nr:redoxin family protein [Sphingomonas sp. DG1-23]MDP5277926.1 redoxin family protein [Sphingomonas sp. DG1-23]
MKRVLIWAPLALFALVFGLVASGLIRPGDRTVHSAMIGKLAPVTPLAPLVPNKPGIKSFATGKPRLVNVFASWCPPCIAEAPQLMKLKQAGVAIDGVATADTAEGMQTFLSRNGDPFVRIGDDRNRATQFAFGSAGVPETFVIDGAGRIAYQHIGDVRADDVPVLLAQLEKAK